jgi:hypothetical protein
MLAYVLIESKVTADFQHGQAQSYAAELAQSRDVLGPKAGCAVLVAPAAKLSTLTGCEVFDDCVSIEEIVDFLQVRIGQETLPSIACAWLQQEGLRCWITHRNFLLGERWASSIVQAIKSRAMIRAI